MKLDTAMEDRTRVLRAVVAATAIAFAVDTALAALGHPITAAEVVARIVGYAILFPIYLALGWWLGTRTWPKRGSALTRRILRQRIAKKRLIFICDRPDSPRSLPRRVWEVAGFSAGVSILGIAIENLLGPPALASFLLLTLLPLLTLWGSFVLVPYWMLSRLGLRTIDPVRWTIIPVGRRYAERARLSNGALVLLGAGAFFNVTLRAGASGPQALGDSLALVIRTVTSILIIAAAAVAYYQRGEFGHSHKLENEALAMGVRDGRGMSDGDFLPRLPPAKS